MGWNNRRMLLLFGGAAAAVIAVAAYVVLWTEAPQREAQDAAMPVFEAPAVGARFKEGVGAGGHEPEGAQREKVAQGGAAARIAGRVLCAQDGEAVPGARLLLAAKKERDKAVRFVSEPDGAFESPPIDAAGPAWLCVRAEGFDARVLEIEVASDTVTDVGAVLLSRWPERPPPNVAGHVVDSEGRPVPGIIVAEVSRVRDTPADAEPERRRFVTVREVTTQADGSFLFEGGGEKAILPNYVHVASPGFSSAYAEALASRPIILTLEPGRNIRGRLVWSLDGMPIEGVLIQCAREADPLLKNVGAVFSDAAGEFELSFVPDLELELGIFLILPTSPYDAPDLARVALPGVQDLGAMAIEGPTSLDVVVVEDTTRAPIPGARVGYGSATRAPDDHLTNESGRVYIGGIPARREIRIGAEKAGFLACSKEPSVVVTGQAGSTAPVEITLAPGPTWREPEPDPPRLTVAGQVVGDDGAPVEGAHVSVRAQGVPRQPSVGETFSTAHSVEGDQEASVWTDSQGRFRLELAFADGLHELTRLTAIHSRYQPVTIPWTDLAGQPIEDLRVVMQEICAWVFGVVKTSSGPAVSGAMVDCRYRIQRPGERPLDRDYRFTTGEDGQFWFPFVSGADFSCAAYHEGFTGDAVRLGSDEVPRHLDSPLVIVLHPRPARVPLEVLCVTPEGRPVAGVEVTAAARWGARSSFDRGIGGVEYAEGTTGSDGRVCVAADADQACEIRWSLRKDSRHLRQWAYILEGFVPASPHGVTRVEIPFGQPVEVIAVFRGSAPRDPAGHSGLRVEALAAESGRRQSLRGDDLSDRACMRRALEGRITYSGSSALAVLKFVEGRGPHTIVASAPGYKSSVSEPFDLESTMTARAVVALLEPAD